MTTCIHGIEVVLETCEQCLNSFAKKVAEEPVPKDNVRMFTGNTPHNFDPDLMLSRATGVLQDVVIVGYDKEGEFFFSSSRAAGPEVLWLLAQAQRKLLEISE